MGRAHRHGEECRDRDENEPARASEELAARKERARRAEPTPSGTQVAAAHSPHAEASHGGARRGQLALGVAW